MRIITCNIRTSLAADGDNNWDHRKELCRDVIASHKPDIICFQEMTAKQHSYLASELEHFSWVGTTDEPAGDRPVNSIFYRSSHLCATSVGGYWLSKTPHIAGTRSWQSAGVRLVTWAVLKTKRHDREFRIVNTHLDHKIQNARVGQARMTLAGAPGM